jgi:E3 ubiquitin-protein ligase UBR7
MLALSLEELGMRALERLPRDRAIDGIRAFNDMRLVYSSDILDESFIVHFHRDDLLAYLRPFAQEGRIVGEADVRQFFETLQESKHSS